MTTAIKKPPRRKYGVATDGTPIVSVTTVLQLLGKPNLLFWSAKIAAEETARMLIEGLSVEEAVRLGKTAHVTKRDNAADAGIAAHAMAEAFFEGRDPEDALDPLLDPDLADAARRAYTKFATWWPNSGYDLVASEQMLVDRDTGYGGTFDMLLRERSTGALVVADLKTGKGIYDEVTIQLGAYATLARLHGHAVTKGLVVHAPVEGALRTVEVEEEALSFGATAFASLLFIHKNQKRFALEKAA